ncbi:hypothetical protein OIU85_002395 [Salix viminalis]|uniref:folate gamma-glutamyl hydrolase n=1 Tax=Salix viminalis TaxID=40686 RepID=A0A9Q0VNZ9_SALVM|nr:hypothetical protein OIU85_002395 [Salix viminalis]
MWNYLWIPFLISLSKELTLARAAATTISPSILLPNQLADDSPSAPRCPTSDINLNYRPVIGILSHPGDGASGRLNNATNASYIAASYVKFVESAGARVIPLIYNEPREILFEKLNLVNGVLFTGGWAKTGLYFNTAKAIFKEVLARNDAGIHFPVYAICLGFEILTMIISEDNQILETYNATDQASTLQFMENISIEGTVFQRFPPVLLKKLSTDCLVMQNHRTKITRSMSPLYKHATIQWLPFQWHPEKNAFEWGLSMIPHSEDAIQVTQHVANFFVSEARKSLNRPPARKVLDNLIYNYSPTYCGKAGKGYDEVYIFAEPETPNKTRCAVHGKCHGHVKL